MHDTYVNAVLKAGGIPVLIPMGIPAEKLGHLAGALDGLLLTGGGDIAVERFNGEPHFRVGSVDPQRDELEISLARHAAQAGLPFLGICRGIQVINVALGGTLYTDIADQFSKEIRHDCYPGWPRDFPAHAVELEKGSRFNAIFGKQTLEVNSFHHQAVKELAPGLIATAFAPDGLIEGVELLHHSFGLGVQWHPECMPESPEMQTLFRNFIEAAEKLN